MDRVVTTSQGGVFLPQMEAEEGITLSVYFHGRQMAQSCPNLISSQPCSSHPQLPGFVAGQVGRVVRLITHAAPHSENWMLPTISFFPCGSGIMPHSEETLAVNSLGLGSGPEWVGGQPSRLGPAAVPDDRGSSGVRCGLVCGSRQTSVVESLARLPGPSFNMAKPIHRSPVAATLI